MMSMKFVLLGLVLLATPAAAEKGVIDKILGMMDDIKAKIIAEGEAADKAYKEFFNWCDDASIDAKHAIEDATAEKEKLEASIEESKATIEDATTIIDELVEKVATAEKDLKDATAVRETGQADFAAAEKELMETVGALKKAIKILSSSSSFIQEKVNTDTLQQLIPVLSVVIDAEGTSSDDKAKLMALIQSDDDDSDTDSDDLQASMKKTGGIVEILEEMAEKSEGELSELRKAETKEVFNFQKTKMALEMQMGADNKEMAERKTERSAAEEAKGTAEGDLEVTMGALKTGQDQLAVTGTDCMTSAQDHELAQKGRAEELKVLAEAKKIIEEAVALPQVSTSFLQVESREHGAAKVVHMVKKLAKRQKSTALYQLSSRMDAMVKYGGQNKADIFAKVKEMINAMIAKLQKEAEAEAGAKAFCDEEMSKTKAKKEDLTADVEKLTARIDDAAAKSTQVKEDAKAKQTALANLEKTQAEMDQARKDENAAYLTESEDLKKAVAGIQKALKVLKEYYGSASGASLLQDSDAAAQQFDDYMKQPAPPAAHEAKGGAGGSIISMLEVAEEDFAKELSTVESEESTAVEEYEKATQENKIAKTTWAQDVKYMEKEAKGLDKTVAEIGGDRASIQKELDAVLEYWDKISSQCVAKAPSYEEVAKKRQEEIDGLKEALSSLESEAFAQTGAAPRRLRRVSAH